MTAKPIWIFFITSVWLFMAASLYGCVDILLNYKDILASYPAASATGRTAQLLLGPIVFFGVEFTFWNIAFRYPADGARILAGFMALIVFFKIIFVSYIVSDLMDPGSEAPTQWLYWYIGLGHMTFALFGKDKRKTESEVYFYRS